MKQILVISLTIAHLVVQGQEWKSNDNNSTTGKLAIGYNGTPSYDLDISREATPYLRIHNNIYDYNPTTFVRKGGIIFNQGGYDKTAAIQFAVPPGFHVPGILFSTKSAWNLPGTSATDWYDRMFIHPSGKIGINTTEPSSVLQVMDLDNGGSAGTSLAERGLLISTVTTQGSLYMGVDATGTFYSWIQSRNRLNTNVYNLALNPVGGNVGIGITNPGVKLDIKSPLGAEAIRILDEGSAPRFSIGQIANYGGNILDSKNIDLVFQSYNNGGTGGSVIFRTGTLNNRIEGLRVTKEGYVGIGCSTPDTPLTVKGVIHTNEVRVDVNAPIAPDYVFEKDYNLLPLSEVEAYVNQNKHLPEVPSAKEMEENGLNLKEMNLLLLKKVEELTLHLIEQNKKVEVLQESNNHLQKQNSEIMLKLKKIESQ